MTPDNIGICLPVTWRRRSSLTHGVVISARSTVLPASGVPPEAIVRCAAVDTELQTWRTDAIGELSERLVDFELEDEDEFELLGRTWPTTASPTGSAPPTYSATSGPGFPTASA